ncbi:MAG: adenylate kinase [Muribaculaceae bacterium]|nr:adenylate kinase [Muribaculaceae bacterium]
MMNLVLFGGPGSGKGTQSARLIDNYGLYHISTGELLRDHIKRETEIGKLANKYISKGHLIPDDLMISIIEDTLDGEAKGKRGVIFDGFPRTIPQAEALADLLRRRGTDLHAVVGLEVPDEELTARLLNRAKESGRSDDNPETIKERLDVYHNQTQPLREHYIRQKKYIPINGKGDVNDIYASIQEGLRHQTGREPLKK